jgi:hypothetical protein
MKSMFDHVNSSDACYAARVLLFALQEQRALRREIAFYGMPPHPDYWQQSISEIDERIEAAAKALKKAIG